MKRIALLGVLAALSGAAYAETIGSVDTAFSFMQNHSIVVDVFDDPRVTGVSCYFSRAKTGGIGGYFGIAEDKSDASVACRQIGPMSFSSSLPLKEEVFTVKSSPLFKHLRIVRMVDPKRRVLVYLVYSDRLIDGSPKNSITAVPVPADLTLKVAVKE